MRCQLKGWGGGLSQVGFLGFSLCTYKSLHMGVGLKTPTPPPPFVPPPPRENYRHRRESQGLTHKHTHALPGRHLAINSGFYGTTCGDNVAWCNVSISFRKLANLDRLKYEVDGRDSTDRIVK